MADTLDDIEAQIRTTIRDLRENPQRIAEYVTAVERERRAGKMEQNKDGWIVKQTAAANYPKIEWQEIPFVVPPDQTISTGPRITQVMDEYEPTKGERARAYLRFAAGEAWEAVKLVALCVGDVYRAVRVLAGRG